MHNRLPLLSDKNEGWLCWNVTAAAACTAVHRLKAPAAASHKHLDNWNFEPSSWTSSGMSGVWYNFSTDSFLLRGCLFVCCLM